jgi:glycosyltransferase involved in cell wall biosynthesis
LDAITHTLFSTLHAIRNRYDVIHYHGVGPSLLSFIPRLFSPRTKIVTTFHCIDRLHQKWGSFARAMLKFGEWTSVKFAHRTITVSHCLTTYCKDKFKKETSYIPNGVNLHSNVKADLINQKFGLEKDSYILFLSRLIRHKGVHHLINAYNKIVTDKKLVIAGGASFTDSYEREIKQLAKDNPNIIFIGNVEGESDTWKELFSNAYLLVHPSESEGLPIVLLEAMSFGRAILASDIPENKEVIDSKYGLTFKNKSVVDLKEKIEYALLYPNVVAKVGQDCVAHVEKNYNWVEIVANVEKVYEGLADEGRVENVVVEVGN